MGVLVLLLLKPFAEEMGQVNAVLKPFAEEVNKMGQGHIKSGVTHGFPAEEVSGREELGTSIFVPRGFTDNEYICLICWIIIFDVYC